MMRIKQSQLVGSKQEGLVLLSTVMLIALLVLLTLSQLQLLLLDYKSLNLIREKHLAFWTLEAAANQLVQNTDLLGQGACLLSEEDPNTVIALLKNKKGCILTHEKQLFYYLIEDLGVFPCLQTRLNKQIYSLQHRRISIRSAEKQVAILQVRLANLAKLVICADKEPKQSKLGLLSWRYVTETMA